MAKIQGKKLWSSFAGFRKILASALKKSNAPKQLYQEVSDTSYEGDGIANELFQAYEAADYHLRDLKDPGYKYMDPEAIWEDVVYNEVHDCVINICSAYQNSWNYAPGHKSVPVDSVEVDSVEVAKKVSS